MNLKSKTKTKNKDCRNRILETMLQDDTIRLGKNRGNYEPHGSEENIMSYEKNVRERNARNLEEDNWLKKKWCKGCRKWSRML